MKDAITGLPLFPSFTAAANYIYHLSESRGYFPRHRIDGMRAPPTEPAELIRRVKQLRELHNYEANALDQRDQALLAYAAELESQMSKGAA